MKYCLMITTLPSKEEGGALLDRLLQEKLVACGNLISSIESRYWWQGKIEVSQETLLLLKTEVSRTDEVMHLISKNHSYEIPEILTLPIEKGNSAYLKWISESLK